MKPSFAHPHSLIQSVLSNHHSEYSAVKGLCLSNQLVW